MTVEAKNEYQWNQGWSSPITKLDVGAVVAELSSLKDEDGEIKPEKVVEAAKSKTHILHNYFLWDNKDAANRYRLSQASELLRRIEVKIIRDGEPKTLRAFEITKRPQHGEQSTFIHTGFDSERAREISLQDVHRIINRLSAFQEYNMLMPVLKSVAEILAKDTTETEKEPVVLQAAS